MEGADARAEVSKAGARESLKRVSEAGAASGPANRRPPPRRREKTAVENLEPGQKQSKGEKFMDLNVIILAAGYGKRMASPLPKVLHPVAGQPMLARILKSLSDVYSKQIRVVAGPGAHLIAPVAGAFKALCFKQSETERGTAKAVLSACPEELKGDVLIINGDHPLISSGDISNFIRSYYKAMPDCAVASFKNPSPNEYGRLIFDGEQLTDIVEACDLKKGGPDSDYVNAGLYIFRGELLTKYLGQVKKNKKEEYNLTSLISILHKNRCKVRSINVPWRAAFGVNSQQELSFASAVLFENKCCDLMARGVIILDPKNTYIESDVEAESGTMIYPGSYLKGKTKIGSFCAIESNVFLFNAVIGNYVNIKAGSYIEDSAVGEKSVIGPYAHLRPKTVIGKECRIGNFVEAKRITMGDQSKAAHLSYLGDAEIGAGVNIGCGTVTCNYGPDKKKRKTKIEDGVFVGSGSQLVAPLKAGKGAVIGAGSVITKDVPEGSLALERSEQKIVKGYNKKRLSSHSSSKSSEKNRKKS